MSNTIPKGLNIAGLLWRMFLVNGDHPKLKKGALWGIAYLKEAEIYVDKALPKQRMYNVLCHELIHAAIYESGIRNKDLTVDAEEKICNAVASLMSSYFIPKGGKWI